MNKRPVLLRTLIALATIAVFACSMYPLTERDFYETFTGMLKDSKNPEAARLVTEAKAMQEKDKSLFASQALLKAADDSGVELRTLIRDTTPEDNRDVMSTIRKNASSSIRRGLDLAGG
ncbi:MAG: hypothetical protein J6R85_00315, partial [Lentisphaeria bacterium]|nr:hypothetical protein [Lentisphaeria bacterium]